MKPQPDPELVELAETAVVRLAIERGYLNDGQLREALLLRQQLSDQGTRTPLLRLLGARYLRPEHQPELTDLYFQILATGSLPAPPPPLPQALFASSDDELAIPEFALEASSAQLQRPPEEDPAEVQEFLLKSAELASEPPPVEGEEGPKKDSGSGLFRWIKGRLGR